MSRVNCDGCGHGFSNETVLQSHLTEGGECPNPKDTTDEENLYECPQCGDSFEQPSRHWALSRSCDYPTFNSTREAYIRGFMLGDGHLDQRKGGKPNLTIQMTNLLFLEYISSQFGVLASTPELKTTGEEQKQNALQSGLPNVHEGSKFKDLHQVLVWGNPNLDQYSHWYDGSDIFVPEDARLTPSTMKIWHCSDGYHEPNRVVLACGKFLDRSEENLLSLFDKTPLTPSVKRDKGVLVFAGDECEALFDYMGKALPGMAYKWPSGRDVISGKRA